MMINPSKYGKNTDLTLVMVKDSSYQSHKLKLALLNQGLKPHQCEDCLLTHWLGKPIPLELDHINGDNRDHRWQNIKLICPNCHALTPTYRGKNRNKANKKHPYK